jgi:Uma2 family endonuclease
MSTKSLRLGPGEEPYMSVEEYLHTTFDGADREYLDGEVVERNMGNKSHGRIQGLLVRLLGLYEDLTGLYVIPEVRHRVQETRYCIPDVSVFEGEPEGEVPSTPPLVAIEILSPDDRLSSVLPKLEEYREWGVRNIWVIDPEGRKLFTYDMTGIHEVVDLSLPKYGITLTAAQVFGQVA